MESTTCCELLEPRRLLAVTAAIESGVLRVRGDELDNAIRLSRSDSDVIVTHWSGSAATSQTFSMNDFTGASVEGAGGNDTLWITSGSVIPGVTLDGGSGNDHLFGSDGDESLDGGDGDDTLWASSGSDSLRGGDGDDLLYRDAADANVRGDDGFDTVLMPGTTADFFSRSSDQIIVSGTSGDDSFGTSGGTTEVDGFFVNYIRLARGGASVELGAEGIQRVQLNGGSGSDTFDLGYLDFQMPGDPPHFVADGGSGDDHFIFHESSDAEAIGGDGNDRAEPFDYSSEANGLPFVGGAGTDLLIHTGDRLDMRLFPTIENLIAVRGGVVFGNALDNYIELAEGHAATVYAGDGDDVIKTDAVSQSGVTVYGQNGNDLIIGSRARDLLDGGNGNDTVHAGDGYDVVYGRPGKDLLLGDDGNDYMDGGADDDILYGNAGGDGLLGGTGNDTLFARDGRSDNLIGGDGSDSAEIDAGVDKTTGVETFI